MKIFGIGLSKTGTTSLTRALEILGYNAIHNPSYMLEICDGEFSFNFKEVELYDALTDIQIAMYYKELDKLYPGSKFILTTRDINGWLKSCENHFDGHKASPDKAHATHLKMYGTDEFDSVKLAEAYSNHLDDVLEYFKDREADLLILDVSEKNKWDRLCSFLNCPIPDEAYPIRNKGMPIPLFIKSIIRRFSVGRKAINIFRRS